MTGTRRPDTSDPRRRFGPRVRFTGALEPIGRALYRLRAAWRWLRVRHAVTRVLGPQYRRAREYLEIDLTYVCDLACPNCNRAVAVAPSAKRVSPDQIDGLIEQSRAAGTVWRHIRLLGGEPVLHPEFGEIVARLLRAFPPPRTLIEIVTNGHSPAVKRRLAELPREIAVDNASRSPGPQMGFTAAYVSPSDSKAWRNADFRSACHVAEVCGMGLTPSGYYICALAATVDRIFFCGSRGRQRLPEQGDDMLEQADSLCRHCSRFMTGHFVPANLRKPLLGEVYSPSWERALAAYRQSNGRGTDRSSETASRLDEAPVDHEHATHDGGPLTSAGQT